MTWFVVGGIAIGATAGAIVGSKKGGDDVWKDALIGGAIGGTAGYGAGALAPAAAAEAAVPAAAAGEGILGAEAVAGGSGLALGGAGLETGGAMAGGAAAPSAGGIMSAASPEAAAAAVPMGGTLPAGAPAALPGSASSFGSAGGASIPEVGGNLVTPSGMVPSPAASSGTFGTAEPFSANPAALPGGNAPFGSTGGANVGNTGGAWNLGGNQAGGSLFDQAGQWISDNPFKAGILGFTALGLTGALNKNNNQTFGTSPVTQAGYPLSPDFKPSRYNPSRSYAEGGITSAATGGVQQTGMFPQSQMDKTQFATASQMPISREIIGSDYDTTIDPYTGDLPRFAEGGKTDWEREGKKFAAMTQAVEAPQERAPSWMGRSVADPSDPGIFVDTDVDTKDQPAYTAAQTRMAKLASKYGVAAQKKEPETEKQMAGGGITSLGGYAAGGNPRLLRGPGDGMSDDIPATIADKQPARLADGEFVVPADVVSGLGNGSTEAGAKKLHTMMDKVRVDRTGSKKQGKKINADKYVPGMADGGIVGYADGGTTDLSQYFVYDAFGNQVPVSSIMPAQQTPTTTPSPTANTTSQGYGASSDDYWKTGAGDMKYSPYTLANRPTASEPQFYGNIYKGSTPDYSTPGYTLTGGNLGRWNNVAGEAQRAAQPASLNQQVTQSFLQNLGRAPDRESFNKYMQSGMTGQQVSNALAASQESIQRNPTNQANVNAYLSDLYQKNLGRAPEQSGQDYWSSHIMGGSESPLQVAQNIQNSPEAQVRQAYQQYLGRTPEEEGSKYWQQQISGGMTPEKMKSLVQSSDEAKAYAEKQAAAKQQKKRSGGILAATK